ncbi:hypothetical protein UFOVP1130_93 [uncultured Caudovirales phage]|uniref:Uncharacterized protein n=1 Tax=uncultured Caudovirales phage TaxID=2100421 RepID=A0A6J5QT06_9CAUD|nr:hypothetical protein UFOVP1130_93 [uncultured Caudovirales phage]
MATKKDNVSQFAEVDEETSAVEVQPLEVQADQVSGRVKGTWLMFWGTNSYDFKDGVRYNLPRDLYEYLKKSGNIYDTL